VRLQGTPVEVAEKEVPPEVAASPEAGVGTKGEAVQLVVRGAGTEGSAAREELEGSAVGDVELEFQEARVAGAMEMVAGAMAMEAMAMEAMAMEAMAVEVMSSRHSLR
jgi:hypothetical protein